MKSLFLSQTTLISLLFFSLFPVTAQPLKQGNSTTTQPTNPNATFEDYKKECIAKVKKDTILKDFAEELCTCTMNEFRKKYSLDQFRALVRNSQSDKTARRTLESVGEECAADIILE